VGHAASKRKTSAEYSRKKAPQLPMRISMAPSFAAIDVDL
jgi:hypothetical protein